MAFNSNYKPKSNKTVNRRYIDYIDRNVYGNYIVNGSIGKRIYSGYSQRDAIRLYNSEARNAKRY